MAAYAALQAGEAGDYKVVKKTILHRYDVNVETHRLRFRQDRKKHNESYREWVCREADHFDCWTKDQEMSLRDMVVMEQVLQNVPAELAVWLKERKPSSLEKLSQLSDDYTQARRAEVSPCGWSGTGQKGATPAQSTTPTKNGGSTTGGPKKEERGGLMMGKGRVRVNARGDKQC